MPWWKNQIEVEKDFVVTYNCHTDEYIVQKLVKGLVAGSKQTKGWEVYASDCTTVAREKIRENKRTEAVTWGLRKSTTETDYSDYHQERGKSQSIRWAVKIPGGENDKIFVFVNSASKGKGQVKWNVIIPKKELLSQLSPRIINEIQWEQGFDDFSGMGIL